MAIKNSADVWHLEQEKKALDEKLMFNRNSGIQTLFSENGILVGVKQHKHKYRLILGACVPKNFNEDLDPDKPEAFYIGYLVQKSFREKAVAKNLELYLASAKRLCLMRENGWHILNTSAKKAYQETSWYKATPPSSFSVILLNNDLKGKAYLKNYKFLSSVKSFLQFISKFPINCLEQESLPSSDSAKSNPTDYSPQLSEADILLWKEQAKEAVLDLNIEKRLMKDSEEDIEKLVAEEVIKHLKA